MATAEATTASLGPRYAPDDPTLPKPWKGLIDGSTGLLYYWNPETNVTQYEKPAALPPPLPPGPPPAGSTPKLAPIPVAHSMQPNGMMIKQQMTQATPQEVQQVSQLPQQLGSMAAQTGASSSQNLPGGTNSMKTGAHLGHVQQFGGSSVTLQQPNPMGDNVPTPFMTFESSGFPPEILREMHSAGFSSPTPIQAQTWPIALQGRDIVAIAKTGSGKTLGYLIPAFILLRQLHNNPRNGPTVLVLAPTRELATQIQDEANKFGRSSRLSCTCLYGGAPKGPQLRELDQGADIVVATPGRLNDILEMKKIDFGQVSLLVLDEADRMLDMGFEPQIRKIVNEMPPHRQTLMYTATWPKDVRKIASDLLVNPVQVNIGNVDELAANKAITQHVEVVPQMEKERRLQQILRAQERGSRVIIFCSTKRLCDQLARSIGRNFGAIAIHGDKSQGERDWVLNQFRSGKSPILVATDVAARGLDIKDIRVVINYDFPNGVEDYVHRIGRTGRAGATGVAYTFFSEQDSKYATDLVKVLEGANQHVPPEVRDMALRCGPGFGKDRGGVSRFNAGGGGGGHWDSGGRGGMRDGGFGGRADMRDGGFGGRGSVRDGGFGGRGGVRDGRFDNRRDIADRSSRGRSRSRSPDRVRTWGYSSRSRSRSRSSRSSSSSWSRSRSWSRGHSRSPSPSHNHSHSRSRSRSRSYDRYERPLDRKDRRVSGFDVLPESQTSSMVPAAPMSPGLQGGVLPATGPTVLLQLVDSSVTEPVLPGKGADPDHQSVTEL
ncbi:DEAD-box ATP-dependent RNA helicase 40 [Citrus sinensis]|uniref:DEAD-box ATP-dependent RNA helicase 40 n=1 Tax=Citrus sinensis TaxID=2711 RepID=A0ACB8IAN8_CITSI|nr:DEAD-box ATP-dependent RNA helicase 40 [Citrus sinensis]